MKKEKAPGKKVGLSGRTEFKPTKPPSPSPMVVRSFKIPKRLDLELRKRGVKIGPVCRAALVNALFDPNILDMLDD